MKTCSHCKIEKELSNFYKNKNSEDGCGIYCKQCTKKFIRQYCEQNKEKVKECNRQYHSKNKEKIKEYLKQNKEKIKVKKLNYYNNKIKKDINFKILIILRRRIRSAIKNQYSQKALKTIELLGCSVEECRKHLESLFKEGMNWNNHRYYGWHIDHIIPCSSFDLTKLEEQKKCCHYTNLQPLWTEENLSKGAKIDESLY